MIALRTMKFIVPALLVSALLFTHPSDTSAQMNSRAAAPGTGVGVAMASDTGSGRPTGPALVGAPADPPPQAAGCNSCGIDCAAAGGWGDEGYSEGLSGRLLSLLGPPASYHHYENLYDAPCIFGGSYGPLTSVGTLHEINEVIVSYADANLPLAGGAGRLNVADNNKPLTEDRVFFLYNHFHHALTAEHYSFIGGLDYQRSDFPVDRYTIGFEKALLDHQWSLDVRLPLAGRTLYDTSDFDFAGDVVGNLGAVLKRMLFETEYTALAAGVGVEIPTGSPVLGQLGETRFRLKSEAVHLSPYLGLLHTPDDYLFLQAFVSVDVPLSGNTIAYDDPLYGIGEWGRYTEQTLLHVDAAGGYWLYRNRYSPYLTGLAAVLELHYTSTLNNADVVYGSGSDTTFLFSNSGERVDFFDFTVGVHADLANHTVIRVGAAFPFRDELDRTYTAEILGQVERRF